jgi:hypothetical protein
MAADFPARLRSSHCQLPAAYNQNKGQNKKNLLHGSLVPLQVKVGQTEKETADKSTAKAKQMRPKICLPALAAKHGQQADTGTQRKEQGSDNRCSAVAKLSAAKNSYCRKDGSGKSH